MTIEFLGAARTVTGSMHLLTTDAGNRILLDCGLYQGRREEAYRINNTLPFDPAELDAVVLSHAHIDHSGNLPSLMKGSRGERFRGTIHTTHASRDLCSIMLPDSAHIQESDADFLRRHDRHAYEPIYTVDHATRVMEHIQGHDYHESFDVSEDVRCTFFDAGHILGSALVVLDVKRSSGGTMRLCFTGDLGRPNRPILRDPEFVGDVDCLICESTYGGRTHQSYPDLQRMLKETIVETMSRGGKLIVPAFAVGRTQDIVYLLNVMFENGELPRLPIYVDSPLATDATEIFRRHPECFNQSVATLLKTDPDPFGFTTLHYVRDVEESKALNSRPEPCVIISASGMMEAGRVVHHLMNGIEDSRNTILVVGFQAEHTLGRRIVEHREYVRIWGGEYKLNARVKTINGLSAHADHGELMTYLKQFNRERMQSIYLVHGEHPAQEPLRDDLVAAGFASVIAPQKYMKATL
ncbi:MAG TPA: MBL fold metallo-hydrolase [Candidatus Kapabacteria bacterium]|nr:MBL fold metallo-hydrolase [Candidatus Kapabacteria bacterium]